MNEDINITLPKVIIDRLDEERAKVFKKRSEYIKDLLLADFDQSKLPL